MREVEVAILDKGSSAGSTTTIKFETIEEFADELDKFEKSVPFNRLYSEFDLDEFSEEEIYLLQQKGLT